MADQPLKRRLAAILAADVAGYTARMEADTDGTVAAWQDAREKIVKPNVAGYSGNIVKLTGDGFLVEFPTVQDAVNCAIAMQQELASHSLEFRMGVNLGDIVDDGEDIHGEGVNVAARLEALAEAGGICISGMVYESIRNRIEAVFEDRGEQQVKNVSAPVRVYDIRLHGPAAGPDPAAPGAAADIADTDKPSLAVLPFENLSADPEQEYFSDGMTEDIITALSRIRWFFVIARNSSFAYKGRNADLRDVAAELGVRYIIEGSLRTAGNRIRLTAELVDGTNGAQIWSERFDRDIEDMFDLQDELTQTIVAAIEPQLGRAEQERAKLKKPGTLGVWDIYQRGMHELHRLTEDSLAAAEATLTTVTETDPVFAAAHAGLAEVHFYNLVLGFVGEPDASREKALSAGRRAVELDQEDANAHCALGRAYTVNRMFDDAIPEFETTLDINPSHSLAHYGLGSAHLYMGSPKASLQHLDTAIRLSPQDTNLGSFFVRKAQAHLYLQEHVEAVDWARRALRLPNFQWSRYVMLISALGHLGRADEAAPAIEELMRRVPNFSRQYALDYSPWLDDDYFRHLADGLEKAGLPEPTSAEEAAEPPALPDKPSIAVLPFDNLSGDAEQEYFSDGITEDIITDLSKVSALFVIARNSTFTYKGKAVDVKQVAAEMAVRYVVEGSVRKAANRVRITAQLIDGSTGGHVWADRYDRELTDIFEVQDEVTRNIVDSLKVVLSPDEDARIGGKGTRNMEAYDIALRARDLIWRFTAETNAEALVMLKKAVELDPKFSLAQSGLSLLLSTDYVNGWNEATYETLEECLDLARLAIELDATDPQGYWALAVAFMWKRDLDRANLEIERAIALDTNLASAYAIQGNILGFAGRPVEAMASLEKAMSLDPQFPDIYLHLLGHSLLLQGKYEDAAEHLRSRIRRFPETDISRVLLASCYGHLGQKDAAEKVWQELLLGHPDFSLENKERVQPYKNPADWEHILDGLRKARLPEPAPAEEAPPTLPDKPSIAVLPFDNLSGDAEQEYFSDGISEDIITALSRIRTFFVIARNTTFTYKGQAVDVQAIAKDLGVRYVLEGSVRKAGNRVRISAQLIDGETGNHLWAEKYDRELEDIFAVQDEITQTVVGSLQPELGKAEQQISRRKKSENLNAWECFQRAMWYIDQRNLTSIAEARIWFRRATEIDPEFGDGYAGFAWTYQLGVLMGEEDQDAEEAEQAARRALQIDNNSPTAHLAFGAVSVIQRNHPVAIEHLNKAIELNPSYSQAHHLLSRSYSHSGNPKEGLFHGHEAVRLSPNDPTLGGFYAAISLAHLYLREHEEAVIWARKSLDAPGFGAMTFPFLISALGHLGRLPEAEVIIAEFRKLHPRANYAFFRDDFPTSDEACLEHQINGLRKAGLPDS